MDKIARERKMVIYQVADKKKLDKTKEEAKKVWALYSHLWNIVYTIGFLVFSMINS